MKKPNELLHTLSPKKQEEALTWLEGRSPQLFRLANALLAQHPEEFEVDEETLWENFNKGAAYSRKGFPKLGTRLKKALWAFLEKGATTSPLSGWADRFEALEQQGARMNYEDSWKQYRKAGLPAYIGGSGYANIGRILETRISFLTRGRDRLKRDKGLAKILFELHQNHRKQFLIRSLRWHCTATQLNSAEAVPLNDEELSFLSEIGQEDEYTRGYLIRLKKLKGAQVPSDTTTLFEIVIHPDLDLHTPEGKELLTSALNLLVVAPGPDPKHAAACQLALYKKGLEMNVLQYEDGRLDYYFYLNIPSVALDAGDEAYAHDFIEVYKDRIAGEYDLETYLYAGAWLLFQKGEFESCIKRLKSRPPREEYFNLKGRFLLAQAYFETHNEASCNAVLELIRKYLSRSGAHLSKKRLKQEKLRLSVFKRLLGATSLNTTAKQKLISQLDASAIPGRKWFLEKLNSV